MNKRRAPQPPEEIIPTEDIKQPSPSLFTRNSTVMSNGDSPVVREKEKRGRNERASSCTPKIYVATGTPPASTESDYATPSPIPRKSLSISSDNLVSTQKKRNVFFMISYIGLI